MERDYTLDEVELVSEGVVDDGIKLTYRVPAETLYCSHGVFVVNRSRMVHVTFPRTHIDATKPKVDAESVMNDDGSFSVVIPFLPEPGQPVEILLNGEKSLGEWSAAAAE